MTLSTHVLDTMHGRPGAGMGVRLFALRPERELVTEAVTNHEGRTDQPLLDRAHFVPGTYELEFAVGAYFAAETAVVDRPPFLDQVVVRFQMKAGERYHVPLLVSPWSYATYRGS